MKPMSFSSRPISFSSKTSVSLGSSVPVVAPSARPIHWRTSSLSSNSFSPFVQKSTSSLLLHQRQSMFVVQQKNYTARSRIIYTPTKEEQELNSQLREFIDQRKYNEAKEKFRQMKSLGYTPNVVNYNTMLKHFQNEMKQGGVADILTYATLLQTLAKRGNTNQMNKYFNQMKLEGIKPDMEIYTFMMQAYNNDAVKLDALLEEMKKTGLYNQAVFNHIIDMFGKKQDVVTITKYIDLMKKDKVQPDQTSYNNVVKHFRNDKVKLEQLTNSIKECNPEVLTPLLEAWKEGKATA